MSGIGPDSNGGDGAATSWVQFDEDTPNDQNAGQDMANGRVSTPPPSLGPISPSKQIQETPPRESPHSTTDPPQPSLPPPPQKQPRNSSPVPLSQLPSNPLAPDNTQPVLPPPPQRHPRQKTSESPPAVIDAQSVQVD